MASFPATDPWAEPPRYTNGSTRTAHTCTPCATLRFPATRGSAHRPCTIGCLACTHGNCSASHGAEPDLSHLGFVDTIDEAEKDLRQLLWRLHRGVVADAVELDGTDPLRRGLGHSPGREGAAAGPDREHGHGQPRGLGECPDLRP